MKFKSHFQKRNMGYGKKYMGMQEESISILVLLYFIWENKFF